MLNKEELKELVFFADKVATVHGPDHQEFIRVNEIVKDIENKNLDNSDYEELIKLTNGFIVPEGACKAQTRLLNLLEKGIN